MRELVVDQSYLKTLDKDVLSSLQANVLKALFKDSKLADIISDMSDEELEAVAPTLTRGVFMGSPVNGLVDELIEFNLEVDGPGSKPAMTFG